LQVLSPSDENVARAASFLRDGSLVAFPTETVYGLGANASDGRAIARLFEAKGRPRFNPLIVHVANLEHAQRFGVLGERAQRLAEAFWPGALTLVVPMAEGAPINPLVTAGLNTVGLRVPSHPIAQKLIAFARVPVAAPSANRSGRISPTTAEHVAGDFRDAKGLIINGGRCPGGVESTVVGLASDSPILLRPGGIPSGEIEDVLDAPLHRPENHPDAPAISPGMLTSHYAPRARVRLNADQALPGEVLLGFGPDAPPGTTLNLSESGDLNEAAANLFGYLRALDTCRADTIAVMPIPDRGLGEAINDRLARAAAPKPNGSH